MALITPAQDGPAFEIADDVKTHLDREWAAYVATLAGGPLEDIITGSEIVTTVSDWDAFGLFALGQEQSVFPILQCFWLRGLAPRTFALEYIFVDAISTRRYIGGLQAWIAQEMATAIRCSECIDLSGEIVATSGVYTLAGPSFYPYVRLEFTNQR